jgi:uncharacterized membrane protein YkgB
LRVFTSIWTYRLLRWSLGIMFVWAGLVKLGQPEVFAVTIDAFGLTPESWSIPLSYALPVFEIILALALIADLPWSLAGIAGLILLFMAVIIYALWLGLDIDCGCYGPADPEAKAFSGLKSSLWRDAAFLAAATYLMWFKRSSAAQAK